MAAKWMNTGSEFSWSSIVPSNIVLDTMLRFLTFMTSSLVVELTGTLTYNINVRVENVIKSML